MHTHTIGQSNLIMIRSIYVVVVAMVMKMTTTLVVDAFVPSLVTTPITHTTTNYSPKTQQLQQVVLLSSKTSSNNDEEQDQNSIGRREMMSSGFAAAGAAALLTVSSLGLVQPAIAAEEKDFLQQYDDFIKDPEGWSYRDVNKGGGSTNPRDGDRVVYEWSGYTIGYFGRPFEAKGGPQGGAFDKDQEYSRIVIGSHTIVKGMESALKSMKVGGIRQVIVPYGELGYPSTKEDGKHDRIGPKPTTFSGERALNFVLDNPRVDRTLLFNVKLIRIDKSDGKGGFIRGDKA
jgi:FKBP-type peptidyl-prolyl cis-trans isomerase